MATKKQCKSCKDYNDCPILEMKRKIDREHFRKSCINYRIKNGRKTESRKPISS